MSTFIKITGGQSPLLQANQAQTAANRQAALERMSREKAGQQGKRERDARRKQEGLDKDGRVIFGVQPRPQPTSAPGVFLVKDEEFLPYFWLNESAVSIDGINHSKISVVSGDSSNSAEYVFSSPNVFSYLSATTPQLPAAPNWPNVTDFYSGLLAGELGNGKDYREQQDLGGLVKDVCITSGSPVLLTAPDGYQAYQTPKRTRRLAYGRWALQNSRQRKLVLPLGNKMALVVIYLRQAAHHRVATFSEESVTTPVSIGNQVVSGNNFSRIVTTTVAYTHAFSNEIQGEIDQEECVCFLVGQATATIIETPPMLLEQLRKHVGQLVRKTETGVYSFLNGCQTVALDAYRYNHTYPAAPTFTDPATGATKPGITYSYEGFAFQRSNEASPSYVDFNGSTSQMRYASYGFLSAGGSVSASDNGCSPLSWYYLDSIPAATSITNATTHEQLRAITSPGISLSVANALPYSKYLGDPAYTTSPPASLADMLLQSKVYAWRSGGGAFEGFLSSSNYPFGSPPWTKQNYQIKKATSKPSALHNLIVIYDWGNAGLCLAQKSLYAIP